MENRETLRLFDLVVKRLLHTSAQAVVTFINHLFLVNHPPNSTVEYAGTEQVPDSLKPLFPDLILVINKTHYYHLETQLHDDREMAIRVFRYGFNEAELHKTTAGNTITLLFPQVRIIYLESTRNTPDEVTLRLIFPDGSPHEYRAKTFKPLEYSIEELEQQKLVLLLPLYILNLRRTVKRAKPGETRRKLAAEVQELMLKLAETLERSGKRGLLNGDDVQHALELMERLYNEVYRDYTEFKETNMELTVVNGMLLTYSEEAELRGIALGEIKGKIETARNMKAHNRPISQIVEDTGLTPEEIAAL
jgi:predicted transposase/invertase (TIGR01784 family)